MEQQQHHHRMDAAAKPGDWRDKGKGRAAVHNDDIVDNAALEDAAIIGNCSLHPASRMDHGDAATRVLENHAVGSATSHPPPPPRYMTRRSLGSVVQPNRRDTSNVYRGPATGAMQPLPRTDADHQDVTLEQSPALLHSLGIDSSLELSHLQSRPYLEQHGQTSYPGTLHHGRLVDSHGTPGNITPTVPKKRSKPPAPLDLSPPRPSWRSTHSDAQQHVPASHTAEAVAVRSGVDAEGGLRIGGHADLGAPSSPQPTSSRPAYAGLGLGLPFSTSASSISSTYSEASLSDKFGASPASSSHLNPSSAGDPVRGPSLGKHSYLTNEQTNSPTSPPTVSDRRGLVGLGELATPRWTAEINERRWDQQPVPASSSRWSTHANDLHLSPSHHLAQDFTSPRRSQDDAESWEGDVLGGYLEDRDDDDLTSQRRSLPAVMRGADSYRSFSDFMPIPRPAADQELSDRCLERLDRRGSAGRTSDALSLPVPREDALPHHAEICRPSQNGQPLSAASSKFANSVDTTTTLTPETPYRSSSASRGPPAASGDRTDGSSKDREIPSYMRPTRAFSSRTADSKTPQDTNAIPGVRAGRHVSASHAGKVSSSNGGVPLTTLHSRSGSPRDDDPNHQDLRLPVNRASAHVHSHHSPSAIANSILRSAKSSKYEGVDIADFAATDETAAEALRKLDGIASTSASASPRVSRGPGRGDRFEDALAGTSLGRKSSARTASEGVSLSRHNSRSSHRTAASSPSSSRPSSQIRKSSSSVKQATTVSMPSTPAMPSTEEVMKAKQTFSDRKSAFLAANASQAASPSAFDLQHFRSEPSYSSIPGLNPTNSANAAAPNWTSRSNGLAGNGRVSPLSSPKLASYEKSASPPPSTASFAPGTAKLPPPPPSSRRTSNARPPSTGAAEASSISSSKRSSSVSLAFGGPISLAGSRDSTSATSYSAYGSPAVRSSSKNRRSSASSDVSSVNSPYEPYRGAGDRSSGARDALPSPSGQDFLLSHEKAIPPVPPLPKDWESYRPTAAGAQGDTSLPSSAKDVHFAHPPPAIERGVSAPRSPTFTPAPIDRPAGPRAPREASNSTSSSNHNATSPRSALHTPSLPSSPKVGDGTIGNNGANVSFSSAVSQSTSSAASQTPTRSKWSLSNAFGLHKSPSSGITASVSASSFSSFGSQSHSTLPSPEQASYGRIVARNLSHGNLSAAAEHAHETAAPLATRKLASVPDIYAAAMGKEAGTASTSRSVPSLPRLAAGSNAHVRGDSERTRTDSLSSSGTINTAAATVAPSVVTTSPGRSRSSLLSPRRTPSGIPFFNRRPSAPNAPAAAAADPGATANRDAVPATASPALPKTQLFSHNSRQDRNPGGHETASTGGGEEKAGRKSILGINLFARHSSRKSISSGHQQAPLSPKSVTYSFNSDKSAQSPPMSATVASGPLSPRAADNGVSEFGVIRPSQESKRSSMSAKASSLIGRRRGKTLPSATESPVKPEVVHLPPMQISALPASTVHRLESLSIDERAPRTPSEGTVPAPIQSFSTAAPPQVVPRFPRTSRLLESLGAKAGLPTIAGSPSVVNKTEGPAAGAELEARASGSPKPATPTRIPRPAGTRSNVPSPQPLQVVPGPATDDRSKDPRRNSLAPGAGMSSSVPQSHSSNFLSPLSSSGNASGASSSGSADESSPMQTDPAPSSSENSAPNSSLSAPRARQSSVQVPSTPAKTSNLPTASSNRTGSRTLSLSSAATASNRAEKRKSGQQVQQQSSSDERDVKSSRTPLRLHHSSGLRTSSKTSATAPATSVTSASSTTLVATPKATRVKGSELPASASVGLISGKTPSLTDGLPGSKSHRSLASKLSIPSRISRSATTPSLSASQSPIPSDHGGRSTSSSRYGTPIGEEEMRADEEMLDFVERQRTKKAASGGATSAEVERLFELSEPVEPDRPYSPESALLAFGEHLSDYEREEVFEHKEVYYVGQGSAKKMATRMVSTNNYGYDDDRGDYLIVEGDHIMFRFEVMDTLGKGSFGQVLRCRDHKTGEMCAVKIIRNKKRFHHQALVEIKVLENLRRWDPEEKNHLLKMGEHFTFRGHLCITTELLSINLYELIKANSFRGFSTNLIRRFTVQILAALSVLRHHRVVHCDLKPENLLLKHPNKSAIKVIDFGSSCFENEKVYTYIQSRFYRSPEVILGMNYHMAIDMWSLGCILAELYTGYPIFPGENEASQLACIMEVLGVPDKHIVDRSSRKKLFFDSTGAPRPTVDSKGRRRRPGAKSLNSVLKCDDELFVDFIAKCLTWDPDRRLKPGPALRHPFCARNRSLLPAILPPRSSSTSSRNLAKSSNISTPRRLEKKASESVYSTPSSHLSATLPATAPTQRIRTGSTAASTLASSTYSAYRGFGR